MQGIFGHSFSVVRLSLKVIKICDSLFANKRKHFSFSSLPWKREAFLLSQTTSAYCVCNSFFFHRWCFPRTTFNCPYNFLKLPNGLTGVTVFELSVGMLIILESCRTILECNSQPSDTETQSILVEELWRKKQWVLLRELAVFSDGTTFNITPILCGCLGPPNSSGL